MFVKRNWLFILFTVTMVACNGETRSTTQAERLSAQNQTATETALAALSGATDTLVAPPPVDTPIQQETSSCDPNQTLDQVRAALPVVEFAVHYNVFRGVSTLVIWSVHNEIPLSVPETMVSEIVDQAWLHAGRVAMVAVNASQCVSELFDAIDTIVVDREYNGWLSGQFQVADIPYGLSFEENERLALQVLDRMNPTYLRQAPAQEVAEGSCDWPQARHNIWSHFSPERKNIAFYYTIDEFGGNVWAQWDGPPDDTMLTASLMNVMLGLECFNPQANIIAIVVDDSGNMIRIAVVPQMNIADIQIQTP